MKISLSAYRKYHTCPTMYRWHYIDRLRPTDKSSALYFGIAIDEALNQLLLHGADPVQIFRDNFTWEQVQGCTWSKYDLDMRMFDSPPDLPNEQLPWASLRVKGRLLLEAYQRDIYPKIEEVISVQRSLDDRPGVIDAIVKIDGQTVLLDHKTSSRPYPADSAAEDLQLALYAASSGVDVVGFAVLIKNIQSVVKKKCGTCDYANPGTLHKTCNNETGGKRCGGNWVEDVVLVPQTQLIISPVNPNVKQSITENMGITEKQISAGQFPKVLAHCKSYYGGNCIYYGKCWKNDETGLEYVDKETK